MLVVFLLEGIVVGIIIAVPVGPVGLICVRRTIFRGKLAGLVSGLGAATADAIFGFIAAFGLTFISDWLIGYEPWLRVAGGCYLLFAGGSAILSTVSLQAEAEPPRAENIFRYFFSTFALTLTNPITILAFLGIFAAVGFSGEKVTLVRAAILVLGVWLGSLLWWLALSFGVGALFRTFGRGYLKWINRGSGVILFFSGAALLAAPLVKYVS
jgi:threonine/homoserine/homoserine lactone efflux protein